MSGSPSLGTTAKAGVIADGDLVGDSDRSRYRWGFFSARNYLLFEPAAKAWHREESGAVWRVVMAHSTRSLGRFDDEIVDRKMTRRVDGVVTSMYC